MAGEVLGDAGLTMARPRLFPPAVLTALVLAFAPPAAARPVSHAEALASLTPPPGKLLFGAYVGGRSGEEDDITPADVAGFEATVGHRVAWVYFSNNWFRSRAFPARAAGWIRRHGATPFVRLMLRSDPEQDHAEPLFTLQRIAAGDFDADLRRWMREAAQFSTPILAEFGTEMNGEWFSWNARWNGRRTGAASFVAACRHIIDMARQNGASNIVWVFHVNWDDAPKTRWNRLENYYPGDSYIDWMGVSLYSMQGPREDEKTAFDDVRGTLARLNRLAPQKPVIVAEFGTDVHNRREPAARWADRALDLILSRRYPIIGFSWWNETWPNDDTPAHDTDLRIASDPRLRAVFRRRLQDPQILP